MNFLRMTLKSESGMQRVYLEVLGPVFFEEIVYGSWRYVTGSEYVQVLFVEDAKRHSYVNSPRSSQQLYYSKKIRQC
jgi:hypothetical protein